MTHKPSGKVYIGMTKNSLNLRFSQHISRVHEKNKVETKLDRFILKSNAWDFKMETLESNIEKYEDAIKLEAKYIEDYDSVRNGLNSSIRGYNTKFTNKLKEKVFEEYLQGISIDDLVKKYDMSRTTIDMIIRRDNCYEHVYSQLQPPPWGIIYPQLQPLPWGIVLVPVSWSIRI